MDHTAYAQQQIMHLLSQLNFSSPHPLGLPSHFSHPVKELGKGSFGRVFLCFYRMPTLGRFGSTAASGPTQGVLGSAMSLDYPEPEPSPSSRSLVHDVLQQYNWFDLPWVAVKLYKPLGQCDARSLEYLKREVVNQRRLGHQHVVGFKEVGITTDYRLYLALEYADSGNLKQWVAACGGRLAEAGARWFLQQLVYGMAYCHAHGVYNRDIKPENLLLHLQGGMLPQPLLKVADFGLSKSTHDSAPDSCVGTPHFMAPEIFCRKQYDGRKADVFSCGVVLFQLVTGALPFVPSRRAASPAAGGAGGAAANGDGGAAAPVKALGGAGGGAGRPAANGLDFRRDLPSILAAMKQEAWAEQVPPDVQLGAECLDLLRGMLRYDPDARMSLSDVKRHVWYREGLSDEIYRMILDEGDAVAAVGPGHGAAGEGDAVPGAPGAAQDGGAAGAAAGPAVQSVEVIEAEFERIMAHCRRLQAEAAERALDNAYDE